MQHLCTPDAASSVGCCYCQADLDAQQKPGMYHPATMGMDEDLIIHGEPFSEHKSTFQVKSAWQQSRHLAIW